ncbi:hypothetical protein BC828DRAFT_378420 [Blastocladiella britannica]|nr:hypothetical protein BC828DRAFT_378420 [Blastocladiella britannica]
MLDHVADIALAHAAGASRSPEDAITVANVLSRARAPSVLAAVLSRGFLEHTPSNATQHGHALDLLPHYPAYIFFDGLSATLIAAATLGSLPVLDLLWRLAGPTTLGRAIWFEKDGLIDHACTSGQVPVLDWILSVARVPIAWSPRMWQGAANAGRTQVLHWALDRGLVKDLDLATAIVSAVHGDVSVVERWVALQPSLDAAVASLKAADTVPLIVSPQALDWWWALTGSKELPEPVPFFNIVHRALSCGSLAAVQWWWATFLDHRTPQHTFGSASIASSLHWAGSPDVAAWLWDHSHELGTAYDRELKAFAFDADWHDVPLRTIFTRYSLMSLPYLQWAAAKCAALGQRLVLSKWWMDSCVAGGHVELLEYILFSPPSGLEVTWSTELVVNAVQYGRTRVLEWWDANRDALPEQNLDNTSRMAWVVQLASDSDAAAVLEWWCARYPVPDVVWQDIYAQAIYWNARRAQAWMRDRFWGSPALPFDPRVMDGGQHAPFTLDFIAAMASHIPDRPIPGSFSVAECRSLTVLFWTTRRSGTSLASLLPLNPSTWLSLMERSELTLLEWWVRAHLAADRQLAMPAQTEIDAVSRRNSDLDPWLADLTGTRQIPVFLESGDGQGKCMVPV